MLLAKIVFVLVLILLPYSTVPWAKSSRFLYLFFCLWPAMTCYSLEDLPDSLILDPDSCTNRWPFNIVKHLDVCVEDPSKKTLFTFRSSPSSSWSSSNVEYIFTDSEYATNDTRTLSLEILNRLRSVLANFFARLMFSSFILPETSKTTARSIFRSHFSLLPIQK